jgi:hypothetical protein
MSAVRRLTLSGCRQMSTCICWGAVICGWRVAVSADTPTWTLEKGFLGVESFYYPATGAAGQKNGTVALTTQLEWHGQLSPGWSAQITPFGRADPIDTHRSNFDLREAELDFRSGAWRYAFGMRRVSWSVTESVNIVPFQVVDIINQRDLAGDPAGQEKLGAAMLTASHQGDHTLAEVYLLPWFRPRRFPDVEAREQPLRGAADLNDTVDYVSGARDHRPGAAFRLEQTFDAANVALVQFRGYAPQPLLTPDFATHRSTALYYLVDMSAVTVQATLGKWLLKSETAYFNTGLNPGGHAGIPGNYWASVSGLEYSFVRAFGDSDLGVIAEWMHDSRGTEPQGTPFPNDLFVGLRWTPNDQADSQFLGGVVRGINQRAAVAQVQYQRRLATQWQFKVVLRSYAAEQASPLSAFNDDELFQMELHYFF